MNIRLIVSNRILFATLLFIGSHVLLQSAGKASKEQALSLPNNQIQARFVNPDESIWKDATQEVYQPQPNLNAVMLKRLPIRDKDGVAVRPVVSILLMPLPEGVTSLKDFSDFKQNKNPMRIETSIDHGDKIIIQGTIEYGGAVHRIVRAFLVEGNVGLDLICDTYDSVYASVKDDFNFWIDSARLTPRSSRTPPALPSALSQHLAISAPLVVSAQAVPLSFLR
ncbi:hypothetical protein [Geothrix sp. PMB-07]|uniref:hypothetical protein n=1 Tax=Geothrix sp. PMB-07 TaxID=3068640 RepID=UPI0027413BE2|nr:hypothetical protein [Geothrix sp. PMB-07]WLT32341.1 hypothetical protein Q9293_03205 [Geothrix sp. PMB-07]